MKMTKQDFDYLIGKIYKVKPDADLIKAAKQIKPVRSVNDYGTLVYPSLSENCKGLRYVEPADVYKETFYFKKPICKTPKLVKLAEITTLHLGGWGFRPKFKEVYAQIPRHWKDQIVAFETHSPEKNKIFGHYEATTCFYGLAPLAKVPKEIKDQKVICEGMVYPADQIDSLQK